MTGLVARQSAARLAIFAVLFQAILFGWHHHELELAFRSGALVALAEGGAPLTPATDEDGCEICIALHHQNAAPSQFFVPALPVVSAPATGLAALAFVAGILERGFQARAPPAA